MPKKKTPTTPGDEDAEFLTLEKITGRWGISDSAIRQALSEGRLVAARVGKTILIEKPDLLAWIRSLKAQPLPEGKNA